MKKTVCFSVIILTCVFLDIFPQAVEYSYELGFNGLFREDSWTPLLIRITNTGSPLTGELIIETANSGTAIEQFRKYVKPVDLPSQTTKEIFFVIPIGHYNQTIRYYFQTQEKIIFEESILLRQKGKNERFFLGVSPYPDLYYLNGYKELENRLLVYPHLDNLPENSSAYDSVDIISIHRELMDRLSIAQFQAISRWVAQGGKIIVWGGKNPSASKWNFLPSEIIGLKKIESLNSLVINLVETPDRNKLLSEGDFDLLTCRKEGQGFIFFATFDYNNSQTDKETLFSIWQSVFDAMSGEDSFQKEMNLNFPVESYKSIFDASGFSYLKKSQIALILFLSASASASMIIFIRFKKNSKNIPFYLLGLLVYLFLLSTFIFISFFHKTYRTDSSLISINLLHNLKDSENALLYKDILIGCTSRSQSNIQVSEDKDSIIRQEEFENMQIRNSPEIEITNIEMPQWSSKVIRLKGVSENLIYLNIIREGEIYKAELANLSRYFIKDSFILIDDVIYKTGTLLPFSNKPQNLNIQKLSREPEITKNYHSDPLVNAVTENYVSMDSLSGIQKDTVLFCGYMNEELHALKISNVSWRKKSINMILYQTEIEEEANEKSSF
jgi:hypothetical protein